jgi:hypothetical protein
MKNRSTIGNNTFIRQHLIEKVYDQIKEKQSILKHDHFFYFDKPIKNGKNFIR